VPIQAVCFDIADVIVEIDIDSSISQLGRSVDADYAQKIHSLTHWEIYDAYERGQISSDAYLNELREYLDLGFDDAQMIHWWNSPLKRIVPDVDRVLAEASKALPIFGLTNTNALHLEYYRQRLPLFQEFNSVIASCEVGFRKPEDQIFERASADVGLKPENILFVDDQPGNVEGARGVGFQAEVCWRSSGRLREILVDYGVLK
jgi:putative hydrolase of the HAD superfamily